MTNYDILKEYEAHKTPVPSYEEWQELQKNLKSITDSYKVVAGRCTQLEKFIEEFNALDVAKENQQLKEVITKICTELVDDDDDMSLGLAEYFSQELLLEISEVLK